MKNYLKKIFPAILASTMMIMPCEMSAIGQNRGNRNNNSHRTTTTNRGNNGNRPASRPENSTNRPGNGNNHKPGNGNWNRPGNSDNHKPGNGNWNRPGNSANRPGGNHGNWGRPPVSAPKPGTGGFRHPAGRPWYRPLPPPPPRPRVIYSVNPIAPVLGLVYGSLVNAGISQLVNAGYNIAGYTNDAIYLSNVMQLGYSWPTATIFYGNSGMNRSRFQYYSPYQDMARYNTLYSTLCSMYGQPVNVSTGSSLSATWWGGSNSGYVTISCTPGAGQNGAWGYYTDLIYGY